MRYFSTFTGIGGFELGIEQAYETLRDAGRGKNGGGKNSPPPKPYDTREGLVSKARESANAEKGSASQRPDDQPLERPLCVGYSEIDKYASAIFERHYPTTHNFKNHGDITKIDPKNLPDFDLLVGGFPCQAFSVAGRRGGFDDTRGTMFFELARIAREKQPRLLLFENVRGLLSHDKGDTFRTIITTLDELGYDCQWQVLNSKNHGVPQNRERVFIVGHLRGTSRPEVFPLGENEADSAEGDEQEQGRETSTTLTGRNASGTNARGTYVVEAGTYRTHKDGRGFRKTASGLSPTIPARAREDGSGQPCIRVPEATKQGYAVAEEGDSINLQTPRSKTRRGRVGKQEASTLDTSMQQYTIDAKNSHIRRLTPVECERLQGFPDGWTKYGDPKLGNGWSKTLISDTQRYKCLGNAVTVNVIRDIMLKLL